MYNIEELTEKVHLLKELERQYSDLETHINNIKDELKQEMTERKVDELRGEDWLVTWKTVQQNRFDSKSFQAVHPELYESFKSLTESKRFTVK